MTSHANGCVYFFRGDVIREGDLIVIRLLDLSFIGEVVEALQILCKVCVFFTWICVGSLWVSSFEGCGYMGLLL